MARRSLNQQVIDLACQAGGEVAWAILAMACIGNAYAQDLGIDGKIDLVTGEDPTSYVEAMASPEAKLWKLAMLEEWQAILRNQTFQAFEQQEYPTETCTPANLDKFALLTPLGIPGHVKPTGSK